MAGVSPLRLKLRVVTSTQLTPFASSLYIELIIAPEAVEKVAPVI